MPMTNIHRNDAHELRCACGSLMARLTAVGIELKCRRCKRVVQISAAEARAGWVSVILEEERGIGS
jgi:phage FluMu protein Com